MYYYGANRLPYQTNSVNMIFKHPMKDLLIACTFQQPSTSCDLANLFSS